MIVDLGSHTNMPHLKREKLYHLECPLYRAQQISEENATFPMLWPL